MHQHAHLSIPASWNSKEQQSVVGRSNTGTNKKVCTGMIQILRGISWIKGYLNFFENVSNESKCGMWVITIMIPFHKYHQTA